VTDPRSWSPTVCEDTVNETWFRSCGGVALLLLTLTGCGKAVNLDHPGRLTPSADPNVLGTLQERVIQLRVDDERLYWLTHLGALRGCRKHSCASSVITYTEDGANTSVDFGVQGGELFYAANSGDVLAVDLVDPSVTRALAQGLEASAFAIAGDSLYVAQNGGQINVVGLASKVGDPVVSIPTVRFSAPVIAAGGDYVYWFEDTGSGEDLTRARKDGTTQPETLVHGINLDPYYPHDIAATVTQSLGLAVDDAYVYWSENLLSGAIKRYPVAGGATEPQTVVAPIRVPMRLWLDGPSLYAAHERDAYQYVVAGCQIEACRPAELAGDLDAVSVFAVDGEYVYTATTTQNLASDVAAPDPITQLRRSAKFGGQSR